MDDRYARRKEELLAECQVSPEVFAGLMERLRPFGMRSRIGTLCASTRAQWPPDCQESGVRVKYVA
jgi:hypothetical protein